MNGLLKPVELKRVGQAKKIRVVLPQLHNENVEIIPNVSLQAYKVLKYNQIRRPDC